MKKVVHVHNGIDYSVNPEGRCDWHACTHNVYNSFDEPEMVKEVMITITLNEDDMGCEHGIDSRVTCGTCMRNWCGLCNPTPSARCPYEYEHDEPNLEDMGNVRGYKVKYDPDTEEYQVEFNGLTLLVDYDDIVGLSGLMHELDHDATRRALDG